MQLTQINQISKSQLKKQQANNYNAKYANGEIDQLPKYIVKNSGPNREARELARIGDTVSSSHSKKGGRKMRAKSIHNINKIFVGRQKISSLFSKAGINLNL